jgi:multiple sugar transport system substrate-binding protein
MWLLSRTGTGQGRFVQRFSAQVVSAVALAVIVSVGLSAAPTTIQLATYGMGGLQAEDWQNMLLPFMEANPDIQVEVQIYGFGEYNEKLMTQIAAGVAPDLMQTWAQYKPKFVEMGLLRDITPEWEKSSVAKKARLYPFVLEAPKSGGRLYGVPFDFNSMLWFANVDYLSERGVVPPGNDWTVEDLRVLARKLTDPVQRVYGSHNEVSRGGTHSLQWTQLWTGHDWVSDDRKRALVDSPENLDMLTFWSELQNDLNVTPGWPGAWAAKGDFYQGGYAMQVGWLSYAAAFADKLTFDWVYAPMPKTSASQLAFAQGHMFSIPVGSKSPAEAWRLAEWLISYEGQKVIVRELKCHPMGPYADLWNEFYQILAPDKRNYAREFVMNVFFGGNMIRTMDYWTSYPEVNTIMTEHVGNIFTRQAPIGNEMRNAAVKIQALLDGK